MCRVKAPLIAAFKWIMGGDEHTILEDADLIGEDVNIEHPAARGVGDAIEIAAHAHHALMGEASFELQHRTIGDKWQRLQCGIPRRRPR
jgi:hypothetical protein